MTKYSYAQLEQLWIGAGGPRAVAPIAAAIAEAESGGDTAAMNYTDNGGTQTSVSLWQVSTGTHSFPQSWLTPAGNAAEAVTKYRDAGNSFAPWGTYGSGAYKAFLSNSTPPDPNVPAGSASTTSAPGSSSGADNPATCLIGGGEGGVFGIGAANFCLFKKTQARALIGGLCLTAAGLVALPGIILIGAAGFRKAAPGATAAIETLAPVPGYGTAIRAAQAARQTSAARQQGAQQARVQRARQAGATQAGLGAG